MAERDFERRLERLFDEAPELADADEFADGVAYRLGRKWTARRWLIGAAGVAGGCIGASQLVLAHVGQRLETAQASMRLLASGLAQIASVRGISAASDQGVVVWVAAGLAVAMTGFVLSRVIEEI